MVWAGMMMVACGAGESRKAGASSGGKDSSHGTGEIPPALAMSGLQSTVTVDSSEQEKTTLGFGLQDGRQWTAKGIVLTLPEGWTIEAPSSVMRLAEIHASKQVVIPAFYFGGDAGGIEANIERWKGQMARMDAISQDSLRIEGLRVHLVVLEGRFQSNMTPQGPAAQPQVEEQAMLLGAIIEGPEGPVFLKAVGNRQAIQAIRAGFEKMVKGVRTPRS